MQYSLVMSIASGQTASTGVRVEAASVPVGLLMPSAFDGTVVSFNTSLDGVTWVPLFDQAGFPVAATVGPNRVVALDPSSFYPAKWLQVVAASTQSAARQLQLLVEKVA